MRRAFGLALMISLMLSFSACGSAAKHEEVFESWRSEFNAAESHMAQAEVSAISEESETVFLLRCETKGENVSVEVLEPQMIARVKVNVSEEEGTLAYDGTVLTLGDIDEAGSSPMLALPLMMELIKEGHLESVWTETYEDGKALVSELENGDGVRMQLCQDYETMKPLFAAVRSGERVELKIHIQTIE